MIFPGYATPPAGLADDFAVQIYADLHQVGATVLASPYSRLSADPNRPRDDFELHRAGVISKRCVVCTHMVSEAPIFERAPCAEESETRLARYYVSLLRRLRLLVDATMRMRNVQSNPIEANGSIPMSTARAEFIARQVKGESPGCDGPCSDGCATRSSRW